MANYKWGEEEPKKKVLDHAKISTDLKSEKKLQTFGLCIIFAVLLIYVSLVVSFDGVNVYTVVAGCGLAAIFAFVLYDTVSCYIKLAKGKYIVEIDTVISIERNVLVRSGSGHKFSDYVRFRNNGDYPIHKYNYAILKNAEVGDTFYVVRYEKKFGKRMPDGIYSTKKYELKEEKD